MDIQQLLYLVKSIENGNISQTAQELNVSQPAVTKGIKKLELEVQAQLIERHGNGIRATATGQALYRHAKAILNQVQRATDDIEFTKGKRPANLSIGCSPSFVDHTLPTILSVFLKEWPACTVTLKVALYPELITSLKNGELDVVLALDFHTQTAPNIRFDVLGQNKIMFIANPQHPLAKIKKLSIEQIQAVNWIILNVPQVNTYFENLFHQDKLIPPKPVVRSESISLIKSTLLSNELIGFLPEHMVEAELNKGSLVKLDVDIPVTEIDLLIAHDESIFPSAMLKEFLNIASRVISNPKDFPRASVSQIEKYR